MEEQDHIGGSHAIISAVPGTGSVVQGQEGREGVARCLIRMKRCTDTV